MPQSPPRIRLHHRVFQDGKATLGALVGFSFVINLLILTLPLYMMQLFDRVLTSQSEQTLVALTVAALGAFTFMSVMERVRAKLLIRSGAWLERTLSPLLYSSGFGTRRGAAHARNLARLQGFLIGPGALALLDAPWTPLFLGVIFLIHPALGAAALLSASIIFGVAWVNDRRSRYRLEAAQEAAQAARRCIEAVGREADTVAAMGLRVPMRKRWLAANEEALSEQTAANDGIAGMVVFSRFARLAAQVLTVALAMHLVISQEIGLGGMIAASLILSRALAPVEQALGQWRTWGEARHAWYQIENALRAYVPAKVLPLSAPEGALALDGVSYTPPGRGQPLFAGVTVGLSPGTFLALTGPSGSGKSTLARLMAGVVAPDTGTLRMDGADYGPETSYRFASHIGYVPQAVSFLPGTVAENISRFTDAAPDRIVLAARRAGVHELILGLPNGYETTLGGQQETLHAGARQRIALAQALFGDPRLLVLDEPYSNLDDAGVAALLSAVLKFRSAGGTTVMIAHRPSVIAQADRVVRLEGGALTEVPCARRGAAQRWRVEGAR